MLGLGFLDLGFRIQKNATWNMVLSLRLGCRSAMRTVAFKNSGNQCNAKAKRIRTHIPQA